MVNEEGNFRSLANAQPGKECYHLLSESVTFIIQKKEKEVFGEMCFGLCHPLSTCIIVRDMGTFSRRWNSPIQRVSS